MARHRRAWHEFQLTGSGDEQCERCEVSVAPASLAAFTTPCPAPDCPAPTNPDRGCVIAPSRRLAAMCVYCGRAGGRETPAQAAVSEVTFADVAAVLEDDLEPEDTFEPAA